MSGFGSEHLCFRCAYCPADKDMTAQDYNSCRYAVLMRDIEKCSVGNTGRLLGVNGEIVFETIDNGGGYWITECDAFKELPPISNADKIKAMSVDEMAAFLEKVTPYGSLDTWKNWLGHACVTGEKESCGEMAGNDIAAKIPLDMLLAAGYLSVFSRSSLRQAGLKTVYDVLQIQSKQELLGLLGTKAFAEITDAFHRLNFKFAWEK